MTESETPELPSGVDGLRAYARRAREGENGPEQALANEGQCDEPALLRLFSQKMDIPMLMSLEGEAVSRDFIAEVPLAYARRHAIVALDGSGGALRVATSSPLDWRALDDTGKLLRRNVEPVLAPRNEILRLLDSAYREELRSAGQISDDLGSLENLIEASSRLGGTENLLELAQRPPLVRLVNRILLQALEARSSDVHFQPATNVLQVRFRIDGVLHDMLRLPGNLHAPVVSRVKVMGRMDIAEKRLPQDGRCSVTIGNSDVDLRISSLPTSHGEQVVVRLLDKSSRLLRLDQLGMGPETAAAFGRLIQSSHGIILVTGPTGSGKTTTLYAALQELNSRERHIVTIEDPIEYQLDGISQSQVNYKKGLMFATALRNVLRQDPDVVMVGEIRDLDTARMAIQSALTGHLVLSTLHTNDSVSATTRLLELGIEPYLVSSALIGVVAQRLVRRICPECKAEAAPDPALLERAGIRNVPDALWTGRGCEKCLRTGFRDRIGIFELLGVNDDLRERIMARERASAMKTALVKAGLRTLRMDGLAKALAGITTLEEAMRVTQEDEA